MGIIFVAGVHGVGKTTCCSKASGVLATPHFTASEIIKTEKVSAIEGASKIVNDVDGNQMLLIRWVERQLELADSRFLLDGHFTLLGAAKEIVEVSMDIFQRLHLDAIVVYRDDTQAICTRLKKRDGMNYQIADIETHQDAELARAHRVASSLQIPVFCLEAFDSRGLEEAMRITWTIGR